MSTGNLDELQREFEVARGAGKWDRAAELSEQIEEIKLKQGQQSQGQGAQNLPPVNLPADFDIYNPQHIASLIDTRAQQMVDNRLVETKRNETQRQKAQKQQNMISSFSTNVKAGVDKIIADGTDQAEMSTIMTWFWDNFNKGNVAEMAHRSFNYNTVKRDAKQKGATDAVKALSNKKQTAPKRASTPGKTKTLSTASTSFKNMSAIEINEYANTLEVDSKEHTKVMEFMLAQVNKDHRR